MSDEGYVSIGFGGGETVIVAADSLSEIKELLDRNQELRRFVTLIARPSGEEVVINPAQVKVLQLCGPPSGGPSGGRA